MNPVEYIKLHEPEFTPSDRKVEQFILESLDVVASFSITEVAQRIGVSKSALLRFCKKVGYAGYAEFRYSVAQYLLSGSDSPDQGKTGSRLIDGYVGCLERIPSALSEEKVDAFARDILRSRSIRAFGVHESGLAAKYLTYRLAALEIDSEEVTSTAAFETKAHFAKQGDLYVFFSVSGISPDITSSIEAAHANGATCALFTINQRAPQASLVDHFMLLPSFDINRTTLFLDSQAVCFVAIDLVINRLARCIGKE